MPKTQTMIHPDTGEVLHRDVRTVTVTFKSRTRKVEQPGWYPAKGTNGVFSGRDMAAADMALTEIKTEIREETAKKVAAIRKRLKLSQRKAGLILGGGARSFQRYESGEVEPSEPMLNLLTVLDHAPKLLKVLTAA